MWRMVMRPWLLRPPVLVLPSTSILTGAPFHRWSRSTSTSWRRPGDVGRYVFSAMVVLYSSEPRRDVDRVPFLERHDGFLHLALTSDDALEGLQLALADDGVHSLHLDVEELLDRRLDLRLGR